MQNILMNPMHNNEYCKLKQTGKQTRWKEENYFTKKMCVSSRPGNVILKLYGWITKKPKLWEA